MHRVLSLAISAAILIAAAWKLDHLGLARVEATLPRAPVFWLVFATQYLLLPVSEFLIFRKLWRLPARGFVELLRKLVSNEILVGYSGELSFYAWARRHAALDNSPFGAIKDVSILSALAGNIVTLFVLAFVWRLASWHGVMNRHITAWVVVCLLVSLAALALRRRLFSSSASDLRYILAMHVGRAALAVLLSMLLWAAALPSTPPATIATFAAVQLLVARLPFVPNKDLIFAGVALGLAGFAAPLSALIVAIATMTYLTHVSLGVVLVAGDLAAR